MKKGPIILIDDDAEDRELTKEAIEATGYTNKIIMFSEPHQAFSGLCDLIKITTPFVILCDINLPKISGIDLKQQIDRDKDLRAKSIPFIFLSTASNGHFVDKAYECCTVQGFFTKETHFIGMINQLKLIFDYWSYARTPNN
ncbi:MAG TPA: response regulator [Chryseosolibacter sp.]